MQQIHQVRFRIATWLTQAGEVQPQHEDDVKGLLEQIRSRGGTPDVMVTNYSMLEYMLVRPLEHRFWKDTASWLEKEGKPAVVGDRRSALVSGRDGDRSQHAHPTLEERVRR